MKPGYCTNIHSGASFQSVIENLEQYSVPIKEGYCPGESMGIGLWLSQRAVNEALAGDHWQQLNEVLNKNSLIANSFNAFPFSDFHQPVVKQAVYLPNWADPRRLQYTLDIAELQCRLLGGRVRGSISTLPVGWPSGGNDEIVMKEAARNIVKCVRGLSDLSQRFGTRLRLAIEPEPGCILDASWKLVDFFKQYLFDENDEALIRQYVGACHDVCHSAVMFERQTAALDNYQAAGIEIAKIQISSAIAGEYRSIESTSIQVEALQAFAEPRYLHQTNLRTGDGMMEFFEDLAPALAAARKISPPFSSRTHFHVPIHLEKIGTLGTTRGDVLECLQWVMANRETTRDTDMEVETYAWDVAPDTTRTGTLVESVVAELLFLDSVICNQPSGL